MRKLKLLLQYALGISRVEANGLLIFLPLILLIIILPGLIRKFIHKEVSFDIEARQLDSLIAKLQFDSAQVKPSVHFVKEFDPNKVSAEALESMGLHATVIRNWLKYLQHGGTFNDADDIGKIYGLSDSVFKILKPYAKIYTPPAHRVIYKKRTEDPMKKIRGYTRGTSLPLQPFDLNLADTLTLKKINGIGPVLSRRIVRYRKLLGGFVNKTQLREVYGLRDSVLQRLETLAFIRSDSAIRYLEINELSYEELAKHPYISDNQAQAVTSYRYQHGAFQSTEDLHNIHLLDSLAIIKIAPYLKF